MPDPLTKVVDRNINTLLNHRREEESRRSFGDKIADLIGNFAGSFWSVYFHLALFGGWLLFNSGWFDFVRPWDPYPFVMLAMFASVEAIFLSTFVLINQNRQASIGERRADLDVHISLLTEHELTRLIQMVDAIHEKLGVEKGRPDDLAVIKQDIPPEVVISRLEQAENSPLT